MEEERKSALRAKALELLSRETVDTSQWGNDVKQLIEELSIYQIELEHQNEELIRSQDETRNAMEKLTIANRQYIDLFENAPLSYVLTDENVKILDVNETFCRTFYLLKKEIIGTSLDRYVLPLFQNTFYHFFKLVGRESGKVASIELKVRGSRSRDLYVKLDAIKELTSSNRYRFAITDISLQKKLETRLRNEAEKLIQSETRFRQIVEQSSNIFFYEDINSHRITYISPKVSEILGYDSGDVVTMSSEALMAIHLPGYRSAFLNKYNLLRKAEANGEHYLEREFELRNKEGKCVWMKGTYSIIYDEYGSATSILGCIQDITERKNIEREIVAAKEKAEESNNLKSAFLANMSHEIRTPLNGILGFSGLLKESLEEKGEDITYAEIIEKSGNRLLEVINDILSISKIEAHQLEIKNEVFNFDTLLNDSVELFCYEANQKALEIKYKREQDRADLVIESDRGKITSIVYNLIKNAIKYTKQGSITIGLEERDRELYFYVQDTGIGIPKDKLTLIFDRFSQVSDTASNNGVGLGLSIAKGLVELLGGKIGVMSEYGKGSTFYFTLPFRHYVEEPVETSAFIVPDDLDLSGSYIIIADDEYSASQLLSEFLGSTNVRIDHVTDGDDLMELLEMRVPQVVVLDLNMPNKSGIQCLKEIREKKIPTKILVQTAYAGPSDCERYINLGADAYIAKPVTKEEFLSKIVNLIDIPQKKQ